MTTTARPTTSDTLARTTTRRTATLALALTTLAAAAPVAAGASPPSQPTGSPAGGAVIWEWNQVAMDVLTPSGRPLLTQPFVVAAMHVAMYDAVMATDGGAEPFYADLDAPDGASGRAAAATAAHDVLVGFLPASGGTFDAALAASLASVPDGPAEQDGIAVGHAAAAATLAARLDDGTQSGPVDPLPPAGAGVWQPTPPATSGLTPWLATATPYTLRSPDQVRPPAPPGIGSPRYDRALDEVRRLGGATSSERTADQTLVARFWADQPVAQNQRTLRNHAMQLGWGLGETARLFAGVLTAEADAFIACWDAKYHYLHWRPWQAVPVVEPGWTPLLGTPNHPEFPSAHGCLTGALGLSLAKIMGTDRIDLDVHAANIGVTRHFETVDDLLAEVGNARVWGGIHFRFSTEAGLHIAHRVVTLTFARHFHETGT